MIDSALVTKVLEYAKLRRRGRPHRRDVRLAADGYVPVGLGALVLGVRVSTLYKARATNRITLRLDSGYWYVHADELQRFAKERRRAT